MNDFLAKNIKTGKITYIDILNDDYVKLTDAEIEDYETERRNRITKINLQAEVEALDLKRIRAICEPGIKDEESGQTWLEYYNEQIQEKRIQITSL